MGRVISYGEKTGYNDGDYLLLDNGDGGTKRIRADRVGVQIDSSLSNSSMAAPADVVGDIKGWVLNSNIQDYMLAAGAFWGCPVIDTMSLSGYNPNTNQLTYTYDGMHPNNKGMGIYGKLFANFILNRE